MPDLTNEQLFSLKAGPKKPCSECPWRKKHVPGWLGGYKPEDFTQAVETDSPIPCHKTLEEGKKPALCAGALIFLHNNCKAPRYPQLAEAKETVGPDRENVFSFTQQFLDHHRQDPVEWAERKVKEAAACDE